MRKLTPSGGLFKHLAKMHIVSMQNPLLLTLGWISRRLDIGYWPCFENLFVSFNMIDGQDEAIIASLDLL